MQWMPQTDSVVVKIPPLHFGKKMRGKLTIGTEVFDGSFQDLEKFVPTLTRRIVTSKFAALFDPFGKLVPATSAMKVHLRRVVQETFGWDDPVRGETRSLWVGNFWRMHNLRGMLFHRAVIPEDAVDTHLQLVAAVDAADVKVAGVWGRFKRKNGQYSCQLIIGRSILATIDSTIPKQELESLVIGSNLLWITRKALDAWDHSYVLLSDSAISLCWTINETIRMSIFHRNRCNQIRQNTDVKNLFHVWSEFNPSDNGSRAEKVRDNHVGPDSPWEKGLPWMTKPLEQAIDEDIIKPATELSLGNKDEDEFVKGFVLEKDLEVLVRGHIAEYRSYNFERVERMLERAATSQYIFVPKSSFDKVVRITALVLKFIRKCKYKFKKDVTKKAELLPSPVVSQFVGISWTTDENGAPDDPNTSAKVQVDDEDVSRALVYWYSKATEEVWMYVKKDVIKRSGVEKEGILFCRSRILDGQRFLKTGEFAEDNVGLDIGLHLLTPLVERNSAIAMSIAMFIHHKVAKHAGAESCYRTSLEYAHILQGAGLFRELGEECVKCRVVRKRYIDAVMGPVSNNQLALYPPFHCAYLDLDGPYECFVPGFERETRNRKVLSKKNYLMTFVCPISKLVNIQVIEARNTQAILEGLTRLGCETGFPAVLVLDQESAFMQVVREAEVNLVDLNLRSYREYGIKFEVAPAAKRGHNWNGLCERKIKTVQDCFEKIGLKNHKLHTTGLQTLCKLVENMMNNTPLGYSFENSSTNTPLLKLLTPNMLRMGRLNSRALQGPVRLPRGPKEMMSKVESLYEAFFKTWNVVMIPRLIPQPKWFKTTKEVKIDDVVYFQKQENDMSSDWTMGQVDSITRSKDGVVRRVVVRYFNSSETKADDQAPKIPHYTDRSVRSLVWLFHINDDYFVHDVETVETLLKELNIAAKDKNEETEARVQCLRLYRDEKGEYHVRNPVKTAAMKCDCCCPAHCALSVHSLTGHATGVTLESLVVTPHPADLHLAYEKELVTDGDFAIHSSHFTEVKDEMYEILTALNTEFELP